MRLASIYDIDAKYSALKLALEEIKVSNVDKVIEGRDLAWGSDVLIAALCDDKEFRINHFVGGASVGAIYNERNPGHY